MKQFLTATSNRRLVSLRDILIRVLWSMPYHSFRAGAFKLMLHGAWCIAYAEVNTNLFAKPKIQEGRLIGCQAARFLIHLKRRFTVSDQIIQVRAFAFSCETVRQDLCCQGQIVRVWCKVPGHCLFPCTYRQLAFLKISMTRSIFNDILRFLLRYLPPPPPRGFFPQPPDCVPVEARLRLLHRSRRTRSCCQSGLHGCWQNQSQAR